MPAGGPWTHGALSLSCPFLWALLPCKNTCCCLTCLRTTSSLSPASCNRRLDHFSRFGVNQLQIPLAPHRVKIKNRLLPLGARSQVWLPGAGLQVPVPTCASKSSPFSGETDQRTVPGHPCRRKSSQSVPHVYPQTTFFFQERCKMGNSGPCHARRRGSVA